MIFLEEPVIFYLVKMINWHHYPISLKYNPATSRRAICVQLMLLRAGHQHRPLHAVGARLSFHYDDDEDRNGQSNYPVSNSEINFQHVFTLRTRSDKAVAWSLGRGTGLGPTHRAGLRGSEPGVWAASAWSVPWGATTGGSRLLGLLRCPPRVLSPGSGRLHLLASLWSGYPCLCRLRCRDCPTPPPWGGTRARHQLLSPGGAASGPRPLDGTPPAGLELWLRARGAHRTGLCAGRPAHAEVLSAARASSVSGRWLGSGRPVLGPPSGSVHLLLGPWRFQGPSQGRPCPSEHVGPSRGQPEGATLGGSRDLRPRGTWPPPRAGDEAVGCGQVQMSSSDVPTAHSLYPGL